MILKPSQARSIRTMNALLDATAALLDLRPFSEITLGEITRRARVTTGAFYARFPSKDAVLHALDERTLEDMAASVEKMLPVSELDRMTPRVAVQRWVEVLIELVRHRRHQLRGIRRHVSADQRGPIDERARAFQDRVVGPLRHRLLVEAGHPNTGHPQPGLAGNLGLFFAMAIVREVVLEEGLRTWPVAIDDHILAREVTRAIVHYMGLPDT